MEVRKQVGSAGTDWARFKIAAWAALVMTILVALLARSALAQTDGSSSPQERTFNLTGTVIDADSGLPVAGVFVAMEGSEWGSISDRQGHFTLKRVSPGRVRLTADQLGYDELAWQGDVRSDTPGPELRLEPQPGVIAGLVKEDGLLQRRRKATSVSAQSFDQVELALTPRDNVADFLDARAAVQGTPCGGTVGTGSCFRMQGIIVEPSVYVDEAPAAGGMESLRALDPYRLYLVEVYGNGVQVRAYTKAFMKHAAATGYRFQALGF